MRLSVSLTDFSWPGGAEGLVRELGRVASDAEAAGLDTLWVADHLIQAAPGSEPDSPMLEAYTTLGFLAARTERIRLGTMVTAATYRPPALLVKAVTTLDVLSGGRAWLGIGAGYHEERRARWACRCRRCASASSGSRTRWSSPLRMWAGDATPFHGRHHCSSGPSAARRRSPPASADPDRRHGRAPHAAAGRPHADACNLFDIPDGGETSATSSPCWRGCARRPAGPSRRSRRR